MFHKSNVPDYYLKVITFNKEGLNVKAVHFTPFLVNIDFLHGYKINAKK